jgi:protein ImuB
VSTLWACFALPELPLESLYCAGANIDTRDAVMRVVHDGSAQRARIVCTNAAARAAGIRIGMAVAQAQVLASELIAQRRDPTAEARQLETLAALAYAFSSQVVLEPPDAVLLEIGASRSLFGDWPQIEHALRSRLAELGHRHTLAAAPTPAAARVLADLADGYAILNCEQLSRVLARVPIEAARLPPAQTDALHQLGTRTLRDVFALPRSGLSRRFGGSLLQALDRLSGAIADPRPLYRPADRFERRLEFDYGIEHQGALRFPLQRLTREFAAFLQARDGGVLRFELQFGHDVHERSGEAINLPTVLVVGLRKPCRDADALFEAARSQLERAALPAPAHALTLVAEELPPFLPERRDLFDPGSRGMLDWDGLAERLRARLGEGAIRPLAVYADHRPERAWRIAEPDAPRCDNVEPPPRPLWLLPKPIPFHGRIVRLLEAPERIETGWWDGDDVRRDYVIADLESGQRAWLFRIAGAGVPAHADGWMLHGWFA